MMDVKMLIVKDREGLRIDRYIMSEMPEESRSRIQQMLAQGNILVNDNLTKSNYKVRLKDEIEIRYSQPEEVDLLPENIPLDILYEDQDLLVVNKPKGMVVHPAPGHPNGTLVNAVLFHCKGELSGINGELRPGIVHRIDRDTTGSLIICKNDMAHRSLAEQIGSHSVKRCYRGIVCGVVKEEEGTIDRPICRHKTDRKKMCIAPADGVGRNAITHYRVLERYRNTTYMEFQLETGRTHQIRVHMASIHHPLLGDTVYGPAKAVSRLQGQTLHAMVIGFHHPRTGEYIEVSAPLPDYFQKLLAKYRQ